MTYRKLKSTNFNIFKNNPNQHKRILVELKSAHLIITRHQNLKNYLNFYSKKIIGPESNFKKRKGYCKKTSLNNSISCQR